MNSLIDTKLLADCEHTIPKLAKLWYEEIGKAWIPNSSALKAEQAYKDHLNCNQLPLAYVAFSQSEPIAMCSLRVDDGLGETLTPWLGSLIVHPEYRNRGIAKDLINTIKAQARSMGYSKLYLLALDPTIPNWYTTLGWKTIGEDKLYHHPVTVMETKL